jgi:hypothetical protein
MAVDELQNDQYDRQDRCKFVTARILNCRRCNAFAFQQIWHDERHPDLEEDESAWSIEYPERVSRRPRNYRALPPAVARVYHELVVAYNQAWKGALPRLPLLATIGLGVLLEVICKDKAAALGPDKNGRLGSVDALEKRLPGPVVSALHEVRRIGNDAKHDVKPLDRKSFGRALDAIEEVVKTLYDLEAIAAEFELRAPIPRKPKPGSAGG